MEQILPNYSVLIQAAIFLIALYVIKAFILTPISQVLNGRREKIEGAEQDAHRFTEESSRLDTSYRARITEARAKAQQERSTRREEALREQREILGKGRGEAQKILEGIRGEIIAESTEARTRLREEAAGLSRILTEKLLGRPVS
jgi:F-type H+-transporting ATPase subunit b